MPKENPTFLSAADPAFFDELYRQFLKEPASVEPSWRHFFEGYTLGAEGVLPLAQRPDEIGVTHSEGKTAGPAGVFNPQEFKVIGLIQGYRSRGHLFTRTNPVRTRRKYSPTLDIENFGLAPADLDRVFQAGGEIGLGPVSLREIIAHLQETYCKSIGAEYMYIRIPERVRWLQERMESTRNRPSFSSQQKRRILEKLTQAVVFENFLHTKFVGQKRFSLAGGETLIPGLDALLETGSALGVQEFFFGMPHRGRLNVLGNIIAKPYQDIFEEFEGRSAFTDDVIAGDVKYHLGYAGTVKTQAGQEIQLTLVPNPSHLEAVCPVAQGMARAAIDHRHSGKLDSVATVLIHGDAAIAGQGVVYEVVQMSLLDGYRTGGTIHIVVNNQLGFTTNYLDGRSSTYCTDVGKVTLSPVFHVNADDVEAVVLAIQLAMEYRQTFHTDVFIDLLGYRRYGHNESDEPRYTQPKLYQAIARHPDPRVIYTRQLAEEGSEVAGEADGLGQGFVGRLQSDFEQARTVPSPHCHYRFLCDRQTRPANLDFIASPPTAVPQETLLAIGEKVFNVPANVRVFGKIRKIYDGWRENMAAGRFDWAMAETLAYATLLVEGVSVRLTGQDCERGTFSHRHAVLLDEVDETEYIPLANCGEIQGHFAVYNSLLSEYAALGFEYGYASAHHDGLTIWEAQFGDFANGAQIITDQYLAVAETKWSKLNGIVLYLPHGSEGQGPEHSSARIERFLALCAGANLQLANCTTPASLFHLLRGHMKYPARVPLIVFTPKSLLRHPRCISVLNDFTGGAFSPVLGDPAVDPQAVSRVLLCSGKIYYELLQQREALRRNDVALIRLEQLYPVPVEQVKEVMRRYPPGTEWRWVQEEPENMGAGLFLLRSLPVPALQLVARKASASPATGFHEIHLTEQETLLKRAFK